MAVALAVSLLLALAPEEFNADRIATIEREQAKEAAAVSEKYGNKKSTELSREERAAMVRDLAAADRKVLDKHGMSARDWARVQINKSKDQASQVQRATKAQEEQERARAAAEQAEAERAGQKEIQIQRGISEETPVTLEEREGAAPVVEQGLPAEYEKDQSAAAESDALENSAETPAPKPAPKSGRGRKR